MVTKHVRLKVMVRWMLLHQILRGKPNDCVVCWVILHELCAQKYHTILKVRCSRAPNEWNMTPCTTPIWFCCCTMVLIFSDFEIYEIEIFCGLEKAYYCGLEKAYWINDVINKNTLLGKTERQKWMQKLQSRLPRVSVPPQTCIKIEESMC